MTGDAVRQLLAEIYDGRGENDPLADYARYDAALTAVLDHIETVKGTGRQSDIVLAVEFEAAIAAALQEQP